MFSIFTDVAGFGFLEATIDRYANNATNLAQTTSLPAELDLTAPQPDNEDSAPLNKLANEIAVLVMGYGNELNIFASGNETVQKHKHCSQPLIHYLLNDYKIFTSISYEVLNSINFQNDTEKLMYICERRLRDINLAVGTIVDKVQDYDENFFHEVSRLGTCCNLYVKARDSLSLHHKIYAVCHSIELLTDFSIKYSFNFPEYIKNSKYDHTGTIETFLFNLHRS